MVINNMSTINKDYFNKLILVFKKNDSIDTTLISRVFENIHHDISEFSEVEFTKYNAQNELKKINFETNNLLEERSNNVSDIYFVHFSSSIYSFFLTSIKIPTLDVMNSQILIKKCIIRLNPKIDSQLEYQILTFMSFLNTPLNEPIIILDSILEEMKFNFNDSLIIETLYESSLYCKNTVLNTLESPYDALSTTNQLNYRQAVNSILKYKNLNPKTNKDNTRLDNLQYYVIDQQVRFYLYNSFKKIICKNRIKFQDSTTLFDHTGNLFFSISIEDQKKDFDKTYNFQQISEYLIERGFFVSYSDANKKIYFGESTSIIDSNISVPICNEQLFGNEIYPLLFRLCDEKFKDYENKIDGLVSKQNYSELEDLLAEIIYL